MGGWRHHIILTSGGQVGVAVCSSERKSTPRFNIPTNRWPLIFIIMENKLYRSQVATIAGVCTGIADYLKVEPIIIQVLFILLYWSPIPIVLIYIFLWLFLKKEPI